MQQKIEHWQSVSRSIIFGLWETALSQNRQIDVYKRQAEKIKEYFAGLNDVEKTKIYTEILSEPTDEEIEQMTSMYMNNFSSRDAIITLVASTMGMDEETAKSYLEDYSDEELQEMLQKQLVQMIKENKSDSAQAQVLQMRVNATEQGDLFGTAGYAAVAKAFDELIDSTDDTTVLAKYYDEYMPSTVSGSTLEETLQKLSAVAVSYTHLVSCTRSSEMR